MERSSVEKIHKADDHIGIASAGHVADARQLIDFARRQAQVNQLRYGEPVGVETLTKEITDHIQQYTQVGGARPFGVALLIGGVENGEPRLFETDPSGTPYEWKALAVGADRGDIRDYLEEHYDEGMDLDEGVDLALAALASSTTTNFAGRHRRRYGRRRNGDLRPADRRGEGGAPRGGRPLDTAKTRTTKRKTKTPPRVTLPTALAGDWLFLFDSRSTAL